jgi:hypothetical protein
MKVQDIVTEGRSRKPLRKAARLALPNHTQYDFLDNNAHPYLAYRFGIAMAGSPDMDMDRRGPIGSNFNMVDYTDGEAAIRRGAERIMGIKPSRSTGKGSEELSQVNKSSVIPAKRINRYGV